MGCAYDVTPPNPPNDGILFVDNSPAGRSGHLGHALVEYEDGKILAFYPNCSADAFRPKSPNTKGHSAVGWMEYKRSEDGGKTWSGRNVLAYSKDLFDAGQNGGPDAKKYSAFAEKAVLTDESDIVVFFLVCDITTNIIWRQFQILFMLILTLFLQKIPSLFIYKDLRTIDDFRKTSRNNTIIRKSRSR